MVSCLGKVDQFHSFNRKDPYQVSKMAQLLFVHNSQKRASISNENDAFCILLLFIHRVSQAIKHYTVNHSPR